MGRLPVKEQIRSTAVMMTRILVAEDERRIRDLLVDIGSSTMATM